MYSNRWLILCFSLLCSGNVNAQTTEQWQFVLRPVLWNASVEAKLSDDNSGGEQPINPDYSFFTLDNLDDYMSLQFEAKRGRFSLSFDSLRARYQDETADKLVNLMISSELGFVELTAGYQLFDEHKLDMLVSVRRTFLDIGVDFMPGPDKVSSSDWTDPLIGLRYNYSFTPSWQLWLRGNAGVFNVDTQRIIDATADVQYMISKHISLSLGYRYLQIDFKEEDFLYEVKLKGARIALGIHF